ADALFDVISLVKVGIVDEALPADGGARLLEVAAHQHDQLAGIALRQRRQPPGVIERGADVVNGAGPDDGHQPRIAPGEDVGDCQPRVGYDVRRLLADRNLLQQDGGGNERPDLSDSKIVCLAKHVSKDYPRKSPRWEWTRDAGCRTGNLQLPTPKRRRTRLGTL